MKKNTNPEERLFSVTVFITIVTNVTDSVLGIAGKHFNTPAASLSKLVTFRKVVFDKLAAGAVLL